MEQGFRDLGRSGRRVNRVVDGPVRIWGVTSFEFLVHGVLLIEGIPIKRGHPESRLKIV